MGVGCLHLVPQIAVKEEGHQILLDPAAGVADRQEGPLAGKPQLHRHRAAGGGELEGVGQQIVEQLLDGRAVEGADMIVLCAAKFQPEASERLKFGVSELAILLAMTL